MRVERRLRSSTRAVLGRNLHSTVVVMYSVDTNACILAILLNCYQTTTLDDFAVIIVMLWFCARHWFWCEVWQSCCSVTLLNWTYLISSSLMILLMELMMVMDMIMGIIMTHWCCLKWVQWCFLFGCFLVLFYLFIYSGIKVSDF